MRQALMISNGCLWPPLSRRPGLASAPGAVFTSWSGPLPLARYWPQQRCSSPVIMRTPAGWGLASAGCAEMAPEAARYVNI